MPPAPLRVVGREAVAEFLAAVPKDERVKRLGLLPTRANTQPALAIYSDPRATGIGRPHALLIISIEDVAISSMCRFGDVRLFPRLGLPPTVATAT